MISWLPSSVVYPNFLILLNIIRINETFTPKHWIHWTDLPEIALLCCQVYRNEHREPLSLKSTLSKKNNIFHKTANGATCRRIYCQTLNEHKKSLVDTKSRIESESLAISILLNKIISTKFYEVKTQLNKNKVINARLYNKLTSLNSNLKIT